MARPADEALTRPGGLAERLYSLRRGAGLSVTALAERLGWGLPKVSKLQRGAQRPTQEDITAWTAACGHPEAASDLMAMLAEVDAIHWRWQQRVASGHAAVQDDLGQLERNAALIRSVQLTVVPGLLQTREYARHMTLMFRKVVPDGTDDVDQTVEARMSRQSTLGDPAKTFEFLITLDVLRHQVGDAEVMRGQAERLMGASWLPNITMAVLPDDAGFFPWQSFLMLDGKVLIEGISAEDRYPRDDTGEYQRAMDAAMAEAVTGDEARQLITRATEVFR